MRGEQGLDFMAQLAILATGFVQEATTLAWLVPQGPLEQVIYLSPALMVHKAVTSETEAVASDE